MIHIPPIFSTIVDALGRNIEDPEYLPAGGADLHSRGVKSWSTRQGLRNSAKPSVISMSSVNANAVDFFSVSITNPPPTGGDHVDTVTEFAGCKNQPNPCQAARQALWQLQKTSPGAFFPRLMPF
uniref:DRBM domain-containing protein n=1 Tax=Mesocestoides corti TaxID=53468 RepID=A0A5K3FNA9_MESCO